VNYYDFFGLEHKLNLDPKDLEQRFYRLSRQWHPDRFARASEEQRRRSLDAAAILNDGYRTLRDPVLRAEYLLGENGFPIGEQKSNNVPPELLEEVFELNMALEELRSGDEEARPALQAARQKFLALRDEIDRELESCFADYDQSYDKVILEMIRGILNRRKYIHNLVREAGKALDDAPPN